ncbi:Protein of unknown function, putative, partial [Plasmodium vivax]
KSLERKYKSDVLLDMNFNRLLAKHDVQRELKYSRQETNLSNDVMNKNTNNVLKNTSSYGQLSKKGKTGLDVYMNEYKRRYRKKKGLSKLDCYCEKKVFDKFNYISDIAEKMQNDKKRFRIFFFKKYGIGLILFSLIPLLGLIIPGLFTGSDDASIPIKLCYSTCKHHGTGVTGGDSTHVGTSHLSPFTKEQWPIIDYMNVIISYIVLVTFLLFIIYALIKIIKYERIKCGKSKMGIKEYFKFCKDLLI